MSSTCLKQIYYENDAHKQHTLYKQLKEEYFKINNKKEGLYKSYYKNGMRELPT